jgi:hypothetical protein
MLVAGSMIPEGDAVLPAGAAPCSLLLRLSFKHLRLFNSWQLKLLLSIAGSRNRVVPSDWLIRKVAVCKADGAKMPLMASTHP